MTITQQGRGTHRRNPSIDILVLITAVTAPDTPRNCLKSPLESPRVSQQGIMPRECIMYLWRSIIAQHIFISTANERPLRSLRPNYVSNDHCGARLWATCILEQGCRGDFQCFPLCMNLSEWVCVCVCACVCACARACVCVCVCVCVSDLMFSHPSLAPDFIQVRYFLLRSISVVDFGPTQLARLDFGPHIDELTHMNHWGSTLSPDRRP